MEEGMCFLVAVVGCFFVVVVFVVGFVVCFCFFGGRAGSFELQSLQTRLVPLVCTATVSEEFCFAFFWKDTLLFVAIPQRTATTAPWTKLSHQVLSK